ncbi:hypothetical protein ACJJTC_001595 [Scirpophaga incertulas]
MDYGLQGQNDEGGSWSRLRINVIDAIDTLGFIWSIPIWVGQAILALGRLGLPSFVWLEIRPKNLLSCGSGGYICIGIWSYLLLTIQARSTDGVVRIPNTNWYRTVWLEGDMRPMLLCGGQVVDEVNLTPINHYVYLGMDDPYCYIELTYDTWWLQAAETKSHCIQEFNKKNCVYVSNRELTSEIEFLEVRTVEDCIGIKGTRQEKHHGQSGWYRVLRSEPPVVTPHVILHVVAKEDGYYQLHEMYKWYSLYLDGKTYRNAELEKGRRKWISPHWLLVTRHRNKDTLLKSLIKYNNGDERVEIIQHHQGSGICDTVLNMLGENFTYWGSKGTSAPDFSNRVTLSCGKDICTCPTVTLDHLLSNQPEHLTAINRSQTWYEKAFDWLIEMIWKFIEEVFYLILGQNWQGTLVTAAISYYVTSMITGNRYNRFVPSEKDFSSGSSDDYVPNSESEGNSTSDSCPPKKRNRVPVTIYESCDTSSSELSIKELIEENAINEREENEQIVDATKEVVEDNLEEPSTSFGNKKGRKVRQSLKERREDKTSRLFLRNSGKAYVTKLGKIKKDFSPTYSLSNEMWGPYLA